MSLMGPFFILIASLAALWLWREGVTEAPWLHEGELPSYRSRRPGSTPARTGLIIFMTVATCLFLLLTASFFMRMESLDWQLPPPPRILWLNTVALVASSASLHIAQSAARTRQALRMKRALAACAATSFLFLIGQLWAWRDMAANGYFVSTNPANAFFYLLTAAHGLHLLGGLVALATLINRAQRANPKELTSAIRLCATYWHFLLGVWLVLLTLLFGWADNFGVICRRLLT
ncbi:cytochrome c oxidase subunit 3 [Methylocystis echinoides]|jgi:cytochrome c oxidase subunit 3|uniref:cytochrome c oxidase subunit 3 n=1 Tax=Methylocystis echinoides TaxID=29468 RepID=UPI00342D652D